MRRLLLLSALLARGGFTAQPAILEVPQGFLATHAGVEPSTEILARHKGHFLIRDTLFKYHAACYGTHASIEALTRLRDAHGIDPRNIDKVELRVPTRNLRVCNIQEPHTGLEAKFSLRMVSAMTLAHRNTADIAGYDDDLCEDAEMVRLRDKMQVVGDGELARGTSEVVISMADGVVYREFDNRSVPNANLDDQGRRLEDKFVTLARPVIGDENSREVADLVRGLDALDTVNAIVARCR